MVKCALVLPTQNSNGGNCDKIKIREKRNKEKIEKKYQNKKIKNEYE